MNNTEYQKYWAANAERILAEDELRHNMNMKWAIKRAMSDKRLPKILPKKSL